MLRVTFPTPPVNPGTAYGPARLGSAYAWSRAAVDSLTIAG